jgi:L-alanine-DL-glutamate epimerase-like enolase superfamily enzyme
VARALDIAVAGGEQDTSSAQFQRMVTGRAVDTLQPDVGYRGGISRTRKIAVLAETAGRRTRRRTSGSRCSIPGPGSTLARRKPGMPEVADGRVAAPTAPGWGVELLPELMASADRRESGIGDAGR